MFLFRMIDAGRCGGLALTRVFGPLWQTVFGDDEDYIRRFFDCLSRSGGRVAAAFAGDASSSDSLFRAADTAAGGNNHFISMDDLPVMAGADGKAESVFGRAVTMISMVPVRLSCQEWNFFSASGVQTANGHPEADGFMFPENSFLRGYYLYAVGTDPAFRSLGLMRRTIAMAGGESDFSFLIPAADMLASSYGRMGYTAMARSPFPAVTSFGALTDCYETRFTVSRCLCGEEKTVYQSYLSGIVPGEIVKEKEYFFYTLGEFIREGGSLLRIAGSRGGNPVCGYAAALLPEGALPDDGAPAHDAECSIKIYDLFGAVSFKGAIIKSMRQNTVSSERNGKLVSSVMPGMIRFRAETMALELVSPTLFGEEYETDTVY